MKTKLLIVLMVQIFSLSWAQNLNFSDAKFKALILTSNATNGIGKNASGVSIAIDANNDGEIQLSEAQNVVILDIKIDETQYIDVTTGEINNYPYYLSHLPDNVSDALLFTNVEELYISDTESAVINYVNNSKIKKVMCMKGPFLVDFTIDNCPSILSMDDVSAYYSPHFTGQAIFRIKNNPQLNGALVLNNRLITELYFENTNFTSININGCRGLAKLSVPDMTTLQLIKITSTETGIWDSKKIDLVANNCAALQEIILDGDYYDSHSVYFDAINVNGCSSLKKIKGLNAPNIDFSTAGLINLEELDCAYYNRYTYFGNTSGDLYWGNVASVNLSGLPKLKTFKAFNQIFSTINFLPTPALEYVDITNTTDKMSSLNISNHGNLKTLLASLSYSINVHFAYNLVDINASNCTALTDFNIDYHDQLKNVNLENCNKLTEFIYGGYYWGYSLETINLKQCSALQSVKFQGTRLKTIELSDSSNLLSVDLDYNSFLENLNINNSANENLTLSPSLNVKICADDFQVSSLQANFPDAIVINCDSVLGTADANSENVSLYPNPTKDFVTIKSDKEIQNIAIYDAQGKLINNMKLDYKSQKINISKLPNGVYYFKVKTLEKELTKRVIKN
jgi:hypothetical protein